MLFSVPATLNCPVKLHVVAVSKHSACCFCAQLSHNRKALLKYLLRIIALGSYSPTGNVAATRPQDEDAQLLFASLKVGCWGTTCRDIQALPHPVYMARDLHRVAACKSMAAKSAPTASPGSCTFPCMLPHCLSVQAKRFSSTMLVCVLAGDVQPARGVWRQPVLAGGVCHD